MRSVHLCVRTSDEVLSNQPVYTIQLEIKKIQKQDIYNPGYV
jgi:hypothetical protein